MFSELGKTKVELRRAIEGFAARLSGAPREQDNLPGLLREFVTKVAERAYTVTDADFASLKEQGYTEDEIYEITVSAAFGGAVGRFERALEVIREAEEQRCLSSELVPDAEGQRKPAAE